MGRKLCLLTSLIVTLAAIGGVLAVYFFVFDKDEPQPVALCGSCHCIVSGSDGTCPAAAPKKPSDYGSDVIERFAAQRPINPYNLTCNPYEDRGCLTSPSQELTELGEEVVCALQYEPSGATDGQGCAFEYRLVTSRNQSLAEASGAVVTHAGSCGVCSTAQDLAAYLRSPDLMTAAKDCSKRAILDLEDGYACYTVDLGFTGPCARIWLYNAQNTGEMCLAPCAAADIGDFDNNGPPPECKLNECLACDERESGEVFQRVAGRTRRRSGLLSAIARPCEEIFLIDHDPCPGTSSVVASLSAAP